MSTSRTREAALAGARRVIAELGVRKASMADIAVRAGMAKATLYNHFRDKSEVVAALVVHEVTAILDDARTVKLEPAKALARVAFRLNAHPVIRGALRAEPVLAVGIVQDFSSDSPVVQQVRRAVGEFLADLGLRNDTASTDVVLRWWLTAALCPVPEGQDPAVLLEQSALLLPGLRVRAGKLGTNTSDAPAVPVQTSLV